MNYIFEILPCWLFSRGKASYFNLIHIKPFIHIQSYVIGLIFGYLIEHNLIELIIKNRLLNKISQFVKLFTMVVVIHSILTDRGDLKWTFLNTILSSTLSFSFLFLYYLVNLPGNYPKIYMLLRSPKWILIRHCIKVSYLMHIPILMSFFYYFTKLDINLINVPNIVINITMFISFNLIVSFVLTMIFEKPINYVIQLIQNV